MMPGAAIKAHDPLAGALAVIAAHEGFDLRLPAADDREQPMFDRLGRFANATGFRFREITLEGDWWKEEGPPFLAIEAANGRPRAVVWRQRRWRIVESYTPARNAIGAAGAAALLAPSH